jgi:PAS domain S-box-containing protein
MDAVHAPPPDDRSPGAPSGEAPVAPTAPPPDAPGASLPDAGMELLDAMPDAVVLVDRQGVIRLANTEACHMFGYSREELVGSGIDRLVPQEHRPQHGRLRQSYTHAPVPRAMGAGLGTSGVRKDGTVIPLDIKLTPFRSADGECVLAVARDITLRAEREGSLISANQELAESNRALEHFAYVASHDLQEPLRKITAFGDRLGRKYGGVLDETGLDYLKRMQGAAGRMSALIEDLLVFSRVTARKEDPEGVEVEPLLDELVADLDAAAERVGGRFERVGEFASVRGRPFQLRQLFQNLLGNALKFHREGVPPVVRIRGEIIHRIPTGGTVPRPWLQVKVEDNGVGFESRHSERIFRIFERLHGRDRFEGTGMGLAICARIVELHGGAILAEGVPDGGATFTVTLPVDESNLEAKDP